MFKTNKSIEMDFSTLRKIYFVGIGGIGMSAIARYFNGLGMEIWGYDKVRTDLTIELENEGMQLHYHEDLSFIPEGIDLVIYTPAIPKDHQELVYFQNNNYTILKRAEVLGLISRNRKTIAVAGTHGKTTTSSILTYILRTCGIDCTAFLGGIAQNYNSNFINGKSEWVVMEADEYDRSFLQLNPEIAIVTSMDADHLDIYGNHDEMKSTYLQFMQQVNGHLILHNNLEIDRQNFKSTTHSYGSQHADFSCSRLRSEAPNFIFDWSSINEQIKWEDLTFSLAGKHNVENATAAIAVARLLGCEEQKIRQALRTFRGIWRRFEWVFTSPNQVYIDDYAHHPEELRAAIRASRSLFPGRKITGVFQPHLYSRTRDFVDGFASALDELDEIILLDIYPARELPIEGVSSKIIFDLMKKQNKVIVSKTELISKLKEYNIEILMTLGAGDIGAMTQEIKKEIFKNQ
jgi:UDP-N-acetylmuramate--alanine ligase